jgi:hypothetical protein
MRARALSTTLLTGFYNREFVFITCPTDVDALRDVAAEPIIPCCITIDTGHASVSRLVSVM